MDFLIRSDRSPQGRRKLITERAAYARCMNQGLTNQLACSLIGIHPRTGKRWRALIRQHGMHILTAPAPPDPHPVTVSAESAPRVESRYLTEAERVQIADEYRQGMSIRAIAAGLGRSPSTISRELARNSHPVHGRYWPHTAQQLADQRRARPKERKTSRYPHLWQAITQRLALKWSPRQIAQALRTQFADQPELHVVHETIYQALYIQGRGQLRRDIAQALRSGRARRRPHRQPEQRQPRFTHPMVMISDRPPHIDDRAIPGHWEGDLIIGKNGRSAIGTLVERSTRYVLLLHLPNGRSALQVVVALQQAAAALPAHLMRSLTWDQGSEMALHHAFTIATDVPVYFCDPASPWQRGSNENTNGLLRQYFPKGTDLSVHSAEYLQAVAAQLNQRPRHTLGWDTPAQRMATLLETTPA